MQAQAPDNTPCIALIAAVARNGVIGADNALPWRLRGRIGLILRAKRVALLGLPQMWRKRHRIQKARVASIGEFWRVLDKRMIAPRFGGQNT